MNQGGIFIQDWDPKHTTKKTLTWYQGKKKLRLHLEVALPEEAYLRSNEVSLLLLIPCIIIVDCMESFVLISFLRVDYLACY